MKLMSSSVPQQKHSIVWKRIMQIENDNDLTGTRITSSKPLSVFSGSDCANVPQGKGGCDHLVEQVPPTVTWWGSKFFVASLEGIDILVNVFVFLVPEQQV